MIIVITTIDTEENANKIAQTLLEKKVAACVQIFPIKSMYRWKGKIEKADEWLCLVKGTNFEAIEKAIKENHPYDTPEILELPITKGNKDYLDWLEAETKL